jgi:transcription antitermination factor NusG
MTTTSMMGTWFATKVRPQHEAVVARWFEEQGLGPFSPTYKVTRQWSDRKKTLDLPLFSGYVFCRCARKDRAKVLNTPGVRSIVSFGGHPAIIPDREIEQITAMVDSGRRLQPCPYFDRGQKICIESGPLKGIDAIVVDTEEDCRLVVSITFLRRSVCVSIDPQLCSPS